MPNLVVDLGSFGYGTNPTFTLTLLRSGVATDPGVAPSCKVTDPANTPLTPSLTHVGAGDYTFQIAGGLFVIGHWTGRAYAPPGSGQTSIDFSFDVEPTRNP